jgi:hypothetical protein
MGKLYDPGIPDVIDGDQAGACGQYGLLLILPTPILFQLWNPPSRIEINGKDFR